MKIRKLGERDIGKIVTMIHDVMGPDDAKKALKDMKLSLSPNPAFKFEEFYVLEIEHDIVAAGGFWSLNYDPDIARLDWFVVPKKYQRKGFGGMLMNFIFNEAKRRKLKLVLAEISGGNEYNAAKQFLRKKGFRETSRIRNYWEDGKASIYLVKRL